MARRKKTNKSRNGNGPAASATRTGRLPSFRTDNRIFCTQITATDQVFDTSSGNSGIWNAVYQSNAVAAQQDWLDIAACFMEWRCIAFTVEFHPKADGGSLNGTKESSGTTSSGMTSENAITPLVTGGNHEAEVTAFSSFPNAVQHLNAKVRSANKPQTYTIRMNGVDDAAWQQTDDTTPTTQLVIKQYAQWNTIGATDVVHLGYNIIRWDCQFRTRAIADTQLDRLVALKQRFIPPPRNSTSSYRALPRVIDEEQKSVQGKDGADRQQQKSAAVFGGDRPFPSDQYVYLPSAAAAAFALRPK